MDRELPEDVDCRPVGGAGERIAGTIAGHRLTRVGAAFREPGAAQVDLTVFRDAPGRWLVDGRIAIELTGRCQRCLEWMPVPLQARVTVSALASPDLKRDEDEDFIEAPGGKLALVDLVEDEILLAVPMMLVHEQTDCQPALDAGSNDDAGDDERRTPFAGLADLLRQDT